ncbi:hypothetical protein RFI_17285 [Reticulomyxa filosa]|uniref:Uncharacterized protein n=1 Tax=Reticulomyxa filosa TaxID=46433 RepID=X6N1L5_RETFI|nr:hypothetical protein RFI_17285 [Reticulomyxa filosa]|eukprot:ETO19936.1 hypothetical protein RFI_17285 [Reticulomyxa filosa]
MDISWDEEVDPNTSTLSSEKLRQKAAAHREYLQNASAETGSPEPIVSENENDDEVVEQERPRVRRPSDAEGEQKKKFFFRKEISAVPEEKAEEEEEEEEAVETMEELNKEEREAESVVASEQIKDTWKEASQDNDNNNNDNNNNNNKDNAMEMITTVDTHPSIEEKQKEKETEEAKIGREKEKDKEKDEKAKANEPTESGAKKKKSKKKRMPKFSYLNEQEQQEMKKFYSKEKHIFIVTWGGRPLYSRYGNLTAPNMISFMGVVSLIPSNIERVNPNEYDNIRGFTTGNLYTYYLIVYLYAIFAS